MRSPGMLGGMLGGGAKGKMAQALAERMGDAAEPRPWRVWTSLGAGGLGAGGLGGGGPRGGALATGARGGPRRGRGRCQGASGLEEEEGWSGDPQGRRRSGRALGVPAIGHDDARPERPSGRGFDPCAGDGPQ